MAGGDWVIIRTSTLYDVDVLKTRKNFVTWLLHNLQRGETVLGGEVLSRVVSEVKRTSAPRNRAAGQDLSEREEEVARLVGDGASNAEIARALYISEGTARNHVSKILRKLGLRDRTRLALYATRRGWTGRR